MQKRIEQLIDGGCTADEARAIATAEFQRAKELIAQGRAADKRVVKTAQDETKFGRLVKEKMLAGLNKAQAEACATEQVEHDNRLQRESLRLERKDAKATEQRDAEVAAAVLAEIAAS